MNRMQKGFFAGVFLLAGISIAAAQSSSEDQQELKIRPERGPANDVSLGKEDWREGEKKEGDCRDYPP